MKKLECLPAPVVTQTADDLNLWLGRREAFSLMAGRCSTADVDCIKRIRDSKLYLGRARDWREFCENHLHMSKTNANHLIGLREKYPEYFQVAQITKITVAAYRGIAHAVSERGIAWNGEIIPLDAEHAERVAAAVAGLQKETAAEKRELNLQDRLAALDADGDRLLKQFRELRNPSGRDDPYLVGSVASLRKKIERLSLEIA